MSRIPKEGGQATTSLAPDLNPDMKGMKTLVIDMDALTIALEDKNYFVPIPRLPATVKVFN